MKTIRILHLGDVHYDEAKQTSSMDLKDPNVPDKLINTATVKPLQAVLRRLTNVELDGIAIVGDLTTDGDSTVYRDCVKYLIESLKLKDRQAGTVHAVSGNHDVNAELIGKDDLLEKFKPLEEAWEEHGVSALRADSPSTGTIGCPAGEVRMFGLNSSVGTAEHQSEGVPVQVSEAIKDARSELAGDEDHYGLNAELFDTPSFVEDHIDETCEEIRGLALERVPIVVAHHNLMPQAFTRVAPYTHVLNGGMARTRLSSCERSVLYLHGHIHESPIEVVRQYAPGRGQLICISAPLLIHGYNLLELSFTDDGLPLGCLVRQFRISPDGSVEEADKVAIPLVKGLEQAGPLVKEIVRALTITPRYRFGELKSALEADLGEPVDEDALADAAREAGWYGLASVEETRSEPRHWRISGALP